MKNSSTAILSLRYICLIAAAGFAAFPIYWMLLVSVSANGAALTWPPSLLPDFGALNFGAYRYILTETLAPAWLGNSILIAVVSTILTILIATPAGYALSRASGAEKDVLGYAILLSKMIPGTLLLAPLYIMFHGAGILNSVFAVILANTSYTVPFATWMMKSYIDGIPRELEEAALVDGDTPLTAVIRVIAPICAPSLAAVTLYVFIVSWNDFIYARTFLAGGAKSTITVGATTFVGDYILEWNTVMAACVIAILPILMIFLWLQKYFVRGITAGHH
jgi:multiple sugar transport system permease protein